MYIMHILLPGDKKDAPSRLFEKSFFTRTPIQTPENEKGVIQETPSFLIRHHDYASFSSS